MLPQAPARRPVSLPASIIICASMPVVVVLPFVPVTTSQVRGLPNTPARSRRKHSSTSPMMSMPADAASTSKGVSGRHPGEVTTRPTSPKRARASSPVQVS